MLKAEGYYADLALALNLDDQGRAGTSVYLDAEVSNAGPESVNEHRIWFAFDPGFELIDSRCSSSVDRASCVLNTPLAAGESASTRLRARLRPNAHGLIGLGGFVESDRIDPNPENDIDAEAISVAMVHSVVMTTAFDPQYPRIEDGFINFQVYNLGPSDAPVVWLNAYAGPEMLSYGEYRCSDLVLAQCHPDGTAEIQVGGSFELSIPVPPLPAEQLGGISIFAAMHSEVGSNVGWPTHLSVWIPSQVFGSSFEY
ncbi:hypothetical protein [Pseudomarimonas arenosa]|uniref:CARDB domain-containing protein n=1 Tax=Pseudomarimonas arenosa TaxID=2774145 RepID=A0AAW3ZMB5_9GAMM|nr:hypothetical protein [Pseudomarimonas arenosa]MBD8526684.1 hypothetical protein [Pseudomarimonas arenosa]